MAEIAQRVNGALMGNFINSKAVLVATLQKLDPSGSRGTFKSTDDQFLQVTFPTPITFKLDQGSLLRLYGTITSKNAFQCDTFSHYSPEVATRFDNKAYDTFLKIYAKFYERVIITEDPVREPIITELNNDFTFEQSNTFNSFGV